jgi:hypothetical protein
MRNPQHILVVVSTSLLLACTTGATSTSSSSGSAATGRVQVFFEAEENIRSGLLPGTADENIKDGWTVTYSKFLVNIGDFEATQTANANNHLHNHEYRVLNVQALPATGYVFSTFEDVDAVNTWDRVSYALDRATSTSIKDATVTQADYDLMVTNGYSIYVEGNISNPAGMSCPRGANCAARTTVNFRWGFDTGTRFSECGPEEGVLGFTVPSGGTTAIKPTLHGDHWWFTSYAHDVADRRAQWLANSDLNSDGEVTLQELDMIVASDVFDTQFYNLSGAPAGAINTALDFAKTATRTLGHFQGDGECEGLEVLH